MSLLSPSHTYYSEKVRSAAGLGLAGRYRINVQIGTEQYHVTLHLPETRTFNEILDDLQPMFSLSEYQRMHTRIFLQTLLGETEVLVNSRPNYATERNIDYVAIPANLTGVRTNGAKRSSRSCKCLVVVLLLLILGLATFVAIDFLVLRPKLMAQTRRAASGLPAQIPDKRPSVSPVIANAGPVGLPEAQPPLQVIPGLGAGQAPGTAFGTTPTTVGTSPTTVDVTTATPNTAAPGKPSGTAASTPQSPSPIAPAIGVVPAGAVLPTTGLLAKP